VATLRTAIHLLLTYLLALPIPLIPRRVLRLTRQGAARARWRSVMLHVTECAGSATGFSHTHADALHRYADYVAMYANCTHVDTNLEIVYLDDDHHYDLSFLGDIREVLRSVVSVCLSVWTLSREPTDL